MNCYTLVARETKPVTKLHILGHIKPIFEEFSDVLPKDLPVSLMKDTQHAVDLVSGTTLSNLPHYRMNLVEHAELKGQVDELLDKWFIRESLSSCAIPILLMLKNDVTWHTCVDSRVINKLTGIIFPFPILMIWWI